MKWINKSNVCKIDTKISFFIVFNFWLEYPKSIAQNVTRFQNLFVSSCFSLGSDRLIFNWKTSPESMRWNILLYYFQLLIFFSSRMWSWTIFRIFLWPKGKQVLTLTPPDLLWCVNIAKTKKSWEIIWWNKNVNSLIS